MKKTRLLTHISPIVILSLILGACTPCVLYSSTDPLAPGYGSHSAVPAPYVVSETIVPAQNLGTIVYAPMGEDTDITVVMFKPNMANEMLMVIPIGATISVLDGPEPGPADVVAALYSTGKVIAIVIGAGIVAYDVYMTFQGIEELTMTIDVGYLPRDGSHNPAHDVENNLAAATATLTALSTWTTTGPGGMGPDNKVRCVVMKAGEAVVRFLIWNRTGYSTTGIPRGDLMWWHATPPEGIQPWADFYPGKSGNTLTNVPQDLVENSNIRMEEWDCNNFPTPPALPGN